MGRGELVEAVVGENDVRRFACRLSSESHCNSCVRRCKNGSVVDAVADIYDLAVFVFNLLKMAELFLGQKIAVVFVKIDGIGNLVGGGFVVAREHNYVLNALISELFDHIGNALSERTAKCDSADQSAVKDNADIAVRVIGGFDALCFKQSPAAAENFFAVKDNARSSACNLTEVAEIFFVDRRSGFNNALCYRV